jgi:Na+-transporting NADH:ubiquinone oxidoreductase subunit A
MGKFVRLKKGFDIRLVGKAEPVIADVPPTETYAVKPTDFQGVYLPKVMVNEGDVVKAGSPLFHDKRHTEVRFCSPVSGQVAAVIRGEKRKLLEIRVLADKTVEYTVFRKYTPSEIVNLSRQEAQGMLLQSGVWPNIIQRPFGTIADPAVTPKNIFVSCFDSHPLAPDYGLLFKGQENFFQTGLDILKKFTAGQVHLSVHSGMEISPVFAQAKGIELHKFSGPHPAGCVGVQIHHIAPINKGDVVWTVNPFGVIQIGKLFLQGIYDASKLVAVTGSEVKSPRYYKTFTGACINKFTAGNLNSEEVRYISGNVLTGTSVGKDGYLGFFDHQLTVIREGRYHEFLGWLLPGANKLSFQRAFGLFSFLTPGKNFRLDTNTHGEPRAFVQTGVFEKVTPMDVLPTHLLKSILAQDLDEMEELGIYEVIEEDLALCEFVDVSKHPVQKIVREGIDLMLTS